MVRRPHNPLDATIRPVYMSDGSDIMEDVIVYDGDEQAADRRLATIISEGFVRLGLKIRSIFCKRCSIKTSAASLYHMMSLKTGPNALIRDYRVLTEAEASSLRIGQQVWFANYDTEDGEPVATKAVIVDPDGEDMTESIQTYVKLSYNDGQSHQYSYWSNGTTGGVTLLKPL